MACLKYLLALFLTLSFFLLSAYVPSDEVDVCTFAQCQLNPTRLQQARYNHVGAFAGGYYIFAGGTYVTHKTSTFNAT